MTPQHGAQVQADGSTRFSLWAPNARNVTLVIAGRVMADRPEVVMTAEQDGWFTARVPEAIGCRYRFRIDHRLEVPDPASRWQPEGAAGPSCVIDPHSYSWQVSDWLGRPWHETVLYEVHPGVMGGYSGIQAQLSRLAEMGVTAIELMPLNEVPGQRNWGYDGVLPFAPQSSYGTPEQLRQLIDQAHALGLMVFVDVVYNHFGPEGNYLGEYAADFFRTDIVTPWGPAIDFRRQAVRSFFCENALMWLQDYRVDGLRLDAVHAISEQSFLVELASQVRSVLPPERHVHLVLENEHNNASLLAEGFDAQWNDDGHNTLHALLTGESESYYSDFATDTTHKLARCLQEGFVYQGEPNRHGVARGEPSGELPPTAFVLFLQNHDQVGNRALGERLIHLTEQPALKAATALLLLSPMIPLLFMGEEWGSEQPFQFFTDYHDELAQAVREGRRNEFSEFSAFADAVARNHIPDPNAAETFHASQPNWSDLELPKHREWADYYRRLLQLRHQHIIPHLVGSRSEAAHVLADKAVTASWTLGNQSRLRIDLNLSETSVTTPPFAKAAKVIFAYGEDVAGAANHLPPLSVVVRVEAEA
ncbi:MAG: malto-oligosyltrehalose trehalohydrolase [Pseudomonas sp.]|uniref:malto-oligosyltrehalose trehalohydrolase n=1 Tax=Halopseudomonas laoshanensis TaxID=2268758 RepID=UPI001B7C0931|nr:malto-oligosyltrehalose trehalohydrolase [Pseudomonas sp.]MBQ0778444.1 malto-oligosyltrehalose trehalohydrolase [Pseudomonas sp.]